MVEKSDNTHVSPWESVSSGTAAAILANIIVYPLDVVKTRLQVQVQRQKQHGKDEQERDGTAHPMQYNNAADAISAILREEGLSGLYSGLGSSILGTASMNFAYFFWSATARDVHQSIFHSHKPGSNSIINELGIGAVGGAMAQLCTNPISVVITRQQTQKAGDSKKGIWETAVDILQSEDGWTGLWRGFKVNLILVTNPMITYGFYQWLRGRLFQKKNIRSIDAFVLGALSKVLATITTHPLIVAKTMLQSKPPECRNGKPFRSFTEVLRYIYQHEGLLRIYKGLLPQIMKGFLVQGLMMAVKERIEIFIRLAMRLNKSKLQQLLLSMSKYRD